VKKEGTLRVGACCYPREEKGKEEGRDGKKRSGGKRNLSFFSSTVFLFKQFSYLFVFFLWPLSTSRCRESDNGNCERLKQTAGMYQESIKPKKKEKVESRRRRRTMQENGLEGAWTSRGMRK